jgi:hypothetical protein
VECETTVARVERHLEAVGVLEPEKPGKKRRLVERQRERKAHWGPEVFRETTDAECE